MEVIIQASRRENLYFGFESIKIWTSGSEGDVVLRYFLSTVLVAIKFGGAVQFFSNFSQGHYEKQFYDIILNLDQ